jgi:hypothetical protein
MVHKDRRAQPLPNELSDLKAIEIHEDMEALRHTLKIHRGNYEELVAKHREFDQVSGEDWKEINPIRMISDEYMRPLHNYAASSYTLISHSQKLTNKFGGDEFSDQYSKELQERDIVRKGQFFKQLRHYTQKYRLPPVQGTHTIKTDTSEFILKLRKDMMIGWDGWNQKAKQYLEELDDRVPIEREVSSYQQEIEKFYDWFQQYTKFYFSEEFKEAADALEQLEAKKPDEGLIDPKDIHPFDVKDFR